MGNFRADSFFTSQLPGYKIFHVGVISPDAGTACPMGYACSLGIRFLTFCPRYHPIFAKGNF